MCSSFTNISTLQLVQISLSTNVSPHQNFPMYDTILILTKQYHNTILFTLLIGASDPYVEVVLMPENKIKIKAVKTKTVKANINPYYGKEFTM